jgi:flavin reductase (DIM6/NTAB) family NADH-FMN oxidoreductase RutF
MTPEPAMTTTEVDPQHRWAVRQFTSGVAVLTLADPRGTHGATVSALVAASRDPLLIGTCLNVRSSFLRRVRDRLWFSVNVLTCQQAVLARWFADPQRPAGDAQFANVDWHADPISGAPLLAGALSRETTSCCWPPSWPAGRAAVSRCSVSPGGCATNWPRPTT